MHLLTKILRRMNVSGWKLVASADVSAKYSNPPKQSPQPLDTYSWFFLKDPNTVLPPGAEHQGEFSLVASIKVKFLASVTKNGVLSF